MDLTKTTLFQAALGEQLPFVGPVALPLSKDLEVTMTTYTNEIIAAAEAIVALGHQADNLRIVIGAGCPVQGERADLNLLERTITRLAEKNPTILEIAENYATIAPTFNDLYPEADSDLTEGEHADAAADYDHHVQQESLIKAAKHVLRTPTPEDDSKVTTHDLDLVYREIEHCTKMQGLDIVSVREVAQSENAATAERVTYLTDDVQTLSRELFSLEKRHTATVENVERMLNLMTDYRGLERKQDEMIGRIIDVNKAQAMSIDDLTERCTKLEASRKELTDTIVILTATLGELVRRIEAAADDGDDFDIRRN